MKERIPLTLRFTLGLRACRAVIFELLCISLMTLLGIVLIEYALFLYDGYGLKPLLNRIMEGRK